MNEIEFIEQNYTLEGDNPRTISGMNRDGLYQLFNRLGYKVGCEVGIEKGKNAQQMFESISGLKLYGVDPYKQHPQCSYVYVAEARHWDQKYLNECMSQVMNRMKNKDFELIKEFSEDAARGFPDGSLDFVYIDGDHSYDMVMLDIILWGRKVRKGGIISGHDYYYEKDTKGRRAKVTQAINDYTKTHNIKFFVTNEDHYVMKGDTYPSWLWVKLEDIYPNIVGF
jgi:predicted O-methyltransferase YrrM